MIIFLNDDKPYLHWVTHHRRGYVLEGTGRQRPKSMVLHRATCSAVKSAAGSRIHLTTGSKWKACAMNPQELLAWATDWQQDAVPCESCRALDSSATEPEEIHLSKLGREILDYVCEAAVIHFEDDSPPYRLTVDDIANCFGTTPGHLSPALRPLFDQGLLTTTGTARHLTSRKKICLPSRICG